MSEQQYLEVIMQTDADLERWRLRGSTAEQPERGSELAIDDKLFPPHPISEAARRSLLSAGEHLRLARVAIEARQLYPSAHFTVLRGALVGSAQAVWILQPQDRASRQERGLTLIDAMYKQVQTHDNDLAKYNLTPAEKAELIIQQKYYTNRRALVQAVRSGVAQINLTDIIAEVLEYVFPDIARREHGMMLWRQMSADAHVLGWSMIRRGTLGPADRRTGQAVVAAGGTLADIAQPFQCVYLLLRAGWSLFDRRCEAPGR